MATAKYIDPELAEALEKVSPAIRKETSHEFEIARRIRDILVKKRWSQVDLARATGKKEATVSLWLSGTHNFTIRTLSLIEATLEEDIISVRKSKNPNNLIAGYSSNRPAYTGLLNDEK
ncbi:MAG: helix-turn-helix domain-containing protein [Bacteroidales bacterium]|nr:helix-turn-helix domain-containing protein [Bacteroidales bacterium]